MKTLMPRLLSARLCVLVACLIVAAASPDLAPAQGNIFGVVQNADLSNPGAASLFWVGFLNHSDQEIRIELNTGAGYDGINWFDDFQNYPSHAAGSPYDYFFVNAANGQMSHLSETVPANSFQQENILLAPGIIPARPSGLVARVASPSRVSLSWTGQPGMTCHVYRRVTSNGGVYRRIDDPQGRLTNLGIADSFFVDTTSDGVSDFTYVLIAQNSAGSFSAHSVPVSVPASVLTAASVSRVTPNSGPPAGGYVVTVFGENFDVAGASVTFGGVPSTAVTVHSPLSLSCTVPAGSPGFAAVAVTNTASGLTSAPLVNGFRYEGATFTRGDVNADGVTDVFDVAYLIDYVFSGGPSPLPVAESGNVDGDAEGIVDVFDLTYLIDYVFSGGPPPPP